MHQKDFSKIKEMNVHSDIVYANQCDKTSFEELEFEGHTAKMISTQTRGVGVNRNLVLTYADAEICLMADDDVCYKDDAKERILKEKLLKKAYPEYVAGFVRKIKDDNIKITITQYFLRPLPHPWQGEQKTNL
jgi:hypothetical protein